MIGDIMVKEIKFYGYNIEELKKLSIEDFAKLVRSRDRRKLLKRGFTEEEKKLLAKVKAGKKNIETHCRAMIILPNMLDRTIKVHNGKEFVPVQITPEKLGYRLGDFVPTRKPAKHSSPGVGASKSTLHVSMK